MRIMTFLTSLIFVANAFAAITVITDRNTGPALAAEFKKQTGVDVNVVTLGYGEIKQAFNDGLITEADVIFVKDLVYLNELNKAGRFQPMPAAVTADVLPAMKEAHNNWTAVTFRARTLVYEASLDVSDINTYEDLAKEDYRGTLCLRTSKSSYNEGLVASLVANYGEQKATDIVTGWVANRAEDIYYGDDLAIIKTIATGVLKADGSDKACWLGLTNSYYLGMYLLQEPNAPVKIKFLSNNANGVHTNGTGAGISALSKQPEVAAQFIQMMLQNDVQLFLTNNHQDYPANSKVKPTNKTTEFENFTADITNWTTIGDNVEAAKAVMLNANYL